MRAAATYLLLVALVASVAGCEWLRKSGLQKDTTATATGPVASVSANDLVEYLNRQASYLNTVRYNDLSIEMTMGKQRNSLQSSTLICAKPKNFLLVGGRPVIGDVIYIGSNDREFWVLTKLPMDEERYIYCSHADFERGAGQLPIPFDPDWALQALGMASYDPSLPYKVDTDQRNRVHTLSWESVTPQRVSVRREIVIDPTDVTNRPVVRQHRILDANNKLIGLADIKEVQTVQTGRGAYVNVPTRVVLEWPQQQAKMELKLGRPRVNEPIPDDQAGRMFTRPQPGRGVNPINLADGRFAPSSTRGATPGPERRCRFGGR
jgi:hypothetical protein